MTRQDFYNECMRRYFVIGYDLRRKFVEPFVLFYFPIPNKYKNLRFTFYITKME